MNTLDLLVPKELPPLSIAAQLHRVTPTSLTVTTKKVVEAEDRTIELFEKLGSIGNATPSNLMEATGFSKDMVRKYLRTLLRQEKVVSFRIGSATWYSVSRPPKRRKE